MKNLVSILFCLLMLSIHSVFAAELAEVKSYLKSLPVCSQEPVFEQKDIFTNPHDKNIYFHIPNLVCCSDGTLIASYSDSRFIRRSEDKGTTWSDIVELEKKLGSMTIDETNGDVLIVGNAKQMYRSTDCGKTWNLESITVKPNFAGHGVPEQVSGFSTHGSESGITLKHGEHKGRLLVPGRICPGKNGGAQEHWVYHYNTSMFSDDHGKTWQVSNPVQSGTGEGTLAELLDGTIYYNSRSHVSSDHLRRIAYSYDGGNLYVDWEVADDLREVGEPFYFKYGKKPSYGCNAGLIALPPELTNGKDVLLFSAPDNPGKTRIRMTVWVSFDRGKSWSCKRLIHKDGSGYSSLALGKNGDVYLLFTRGKDTKNPYDAMAFVRFNLAWLFEPVLNEVIE
jgi:sialidase-1